MSNIPHTEFGVCHVPQVHHGWEEPIPTVTSWKAAREINISHVRMNYALDHLDLFEPDFRAARDGGQNVTANMGVGDVDTATPDAIEAAAFDLVMHYGPELESVSFENEYGGMRGMSPQAGVLDISQGGTFDFIKEVIGPLLLAFMRGVRRANSNILIDLFDADSTDVQQRSMALLIGTEFENDQRIRWCAHNYADVGGDPAHGNPGGQDYSSMAGMNGKSGFLSVFEDQRFTPRDWYISEIGKTTGPFGGIAEPDDRQVMLRYTRMMLSTYPQCRKIDFLSAKFFFERVPAPPGVPPGTWCTWTFGDPVVSADGLEFKRLFAPDPIKTTQPVGRRRATRS